MSDGKRKTKKITNFWWDMWYGRYLRIEVGVTQYCVVKNFWFLPVATYLIDFFPDFLINDPAKSPEKYRFPYKNIGLDHLAFVFEMNNRLEILEEAEKKSMSFGDFFDWVVNYAFLYNDKVGYDKYSLVRGHKSWVHIMDNDLSRGWYFKPFNFPLS